MKIYSKNKDISNLVKKIIISGWQYHRGKKHRLLIAPSGNKLTIPSTPSDYRAFYNFRQQVKALSIKGINYET